MKTSILNVTLGRRSSALEEGSLAFEQEPWSKNLGYLTKVGTVMMIGRILGGTVDPAPFCGDDGEGYSKKIYVYPCPHYLDYQIGISSGTISGRIYDNIEFSEELRINYTTETPLRFCSLNVIRYEWVGDTFNESGEVTSKPSVILKLGFAMVSKKIYGILKVTYGIIRHVYEARVRPILAAEENSLTCYIWAAWDGGNGYLEVEPPPGAEEKVCNNRRDFGIGIPLDGLDGLESGDTLVFSPSGIPECVRPEDEVEYEDYCTGGKIL